MFRKLQDEIGRELSGFEKLKNEKRIDGEFYDIVKTDIESYISFRLLKTLESRHKKANGIPMIFNLPDSLPYINATEPQYVSMIDTIFRLYPIERQYSWLTSMYDGYLNNFLWYKSLTDTCCKKQGEDNDLMTKLSLAKKYLKPDEYEYFFAKQFNCITPGLECLNPINDWTKFLF
jgi:hypothetical protein